MAGNTWKSFISAEYIKSIVGRDPFGELIWLPRTVETYHPMGTGSPWSYTEKDVDKFNDHYAYKRVIGLKATKRQPAVIKFWGLYVPRDVVEFIVGEDPSEF